MAIKFTKKYINEQQYISDLARTNKYYDGLTIQELEKNSAESAEQFKYMLADTRNKSVDSFDNTKYKVLSGESKLSYLYNEFYQDRNETAIDENGEEYNVYETRKEQLNEVAADALARQEYESMDAFGKVIYNIGGFLGDVFTTLTQIPEDIIDATLFVAEGIARVAGDENSANDIRKTMMKDSTGARALREDMDRFVRNYTDIESNAITSTARQVSQSITQMAPMIVASTISGFLGGGPVGAVISALGSTIYYVSMAGSTANSIVQANPNINYGSLFLYTAGTTAIEIATEKMSDVLFKNVTVADVLTHGAKSTSKSTTNRIWTNAFKQMGLDMATEGLEELTSELFSGLLYKYTIDPTAPAISVSDLFNAAIIGGLTGGVMSGGRIATTKRYAVDSKGELRTLKDIKSEAKATGVKTKDIVSKKLSRASSFGLLQAMDAASALTETNVAELKAKTGLSLDELATSSKYAKQYEAAVKKDTEIGIKKAQYSLALAKYMEKIGVSAFSKASQILNDNIAEARKMVENYNNHKTNISAKNRAYERLFSEANNLANVTINDNVSDEFKKTAEALKEKYGIELLSGTIGHIDGDSVKPVTSVHGAIIVDEKLVKELSPKALFETVIKEQLVNALITDNIILGEAGAREVLRKVMPENFDVSQPLNDDLKRTVNQMLLFDDFAIEKVFLQDKSIFTRMARWLRRKIENNRKANKTEANKIEFSELLKARDRYIRSVAKNIGNTQDAEKAAKIFDMSNEEMVAKLLDIMQADEFNEHLALMDINLNKETITRVNVNRFFKSLIKKNNLNPDGTINWDVAENPEIYTDEIRRKIAEEYPGESFTAGLYYFIFETTGMCVSFRNKTITKPVNLIKKTDKKFKSVLERAVEYSDNLEIIKKYNSIQSIFGDKFNKIFSQEELDRVTIKYEKDLQKPGYIEIKRSGEMIIHINYSRPDILIRTLYHEINHAFAHLQGLPEGTSVVETKRVAENLSDAQLFSIASKLFTKETIDSWNKETLIAKVGYQLYYQSYGERYARGEIHEFHNESGFDIINGSIVGFGKYRGFIAKIISGEAAFAEENVSRQTAKQVETTLHNKYQSNAELMRKAGYSNEFILDFLDVNYKKNLSFYIENITNTIIRNGAPMGDRNAVNDLIQTIFPNNTNINSIESLITTYETPVGEGRKIDGTFEKGKLSRTGRSVLELSISYALLKESIINNNFEWLDEYYKEYIDSLDMKTKDADEAANNKAILEQNEFEKKKIKTDMLSIFEPIKTTISARSDDSKLTLSNLVSTLIGDVDSETKTYVLDKTKHDISKVLFGYVHSLINSPENSKDLVYKYLLETDYNRSVSESEKLYKKLKKGLSFDLTISDKKLSGKKGEGDKTRLEQASDIEAVKEYEEEESIEDVPEESIEDVSEESFDEEKQINAVEKNIKNLQEWLNAPQKTQEKISKIQKYLNNVKKYKAVLTNKNISSDVKDVIKNETNLDVFLEEIDTVINNINISDDVAAKKQMGDLRERINTVKASIIDVYGESAWDETLKHLPLERGKISKSTKSAEELLNDIKRKRGDVVEQEKKPVVEKPVSLIRTTIAPYYNTQATEENFEEIKNKVEKDFINYADTVASSLKVKISSFDTNFGSFTFSEGDIAGNIVTELSYTFNLDTTDSQKADLFASIMGDLAHEQQEAVISANYTNDSNKANCIEVLIKVKDTENVVKQLKSVGINDYTVNLNNKTISILNFDLENFEVREDIKKLQDLLGDNYESTETNFVESRYLDKEARRNTYQSWLSTNSERSENRQLYSYITEASEKVKETVIEETPSTEAVTEKEDITPNGKYTEKQQRLIKGINDKTYRTDPESILYEEAESIAMGYSPDADKEYGVRSQFAFESVKEDILSGITEDDLLPMLSAIENGDIHGFEAAAFLNWMAIKGYMFSTNEEIKNKYDSLRKEITGTAGSVLAASRWRLSPNNHIAAVISDVTKEISVPFDFSEDFIDKYLPEVNDLKSEIEEQTKTIASLYTQLKETEDAYEQYKIKQELREAQIRKNLLARNDKIALLEKKITELLEKDTEQSKNLEKVNQLYADAMQELQKFVEQNESKISKEKTKGKSILSPSQQETRDKWLTRFESYRYLALLSNPATWGRNAITNTLVAGTELLVDFLGKQYSKIGNRPEYIKRVGYYGDYDSSFKKTVEDLFNVQIKADTTGSKYDKNALDKAQREYAKAKGEKAKGEAFVKIENFVYEKALNDKPWVVKRILRNLTNTLAGSRELLVGEIFSKISAQYNRVGYNKASGRIDDIPAIIAEVSKTNSALGIQLQAIFDGDLSETILLSKELNPTGIISEIYNDAVFRGNELFFKVNTKLSDWLSDKKIKNSAAGMLISAVIPFVRTQINTGLYALKHSPVGLAMGIHKWLTNKKSNNNDMRAELLSYYKKQYSSAIAAQKKAWKKQGNKGELKQETFDSWLSKPNNCSPETLAVLNGSDKNIKQIYEQHYSDNKVAGTTIGISDLFGHAKAVELLSQGSVGTAALILGIILNSIFDLFEIDEEDYLGPILKIGSIKISLDSLSPVSAGFSIGALLASDSKDKLSNLWELMINQTIFSTLESSLKYNDSSLSWFQNQAINYVQQYIPGIVKPITKIIDRSKKDKSGNFWEKLYKTTLSNIPVASYIIGDKINPYTGETQKHYHTFIGAILGAYFPITIRYSKKSELEKAAELYGAKTTGLAGKFTYNGKDYAIDDKYAEALNKYRAEYIKSEYGLISSGKKLVTVEDVNGKRITTSWKKLTEEQRNAVLKRIYTEASSVTKIKHWTINLGNIYKTNNKNEYQIYRKLFGGNVQFNSNWNKSKFIER